MPAGRLVDSSAGTAVEWLSRGDAAPPAPTLVIQTAHLGDLVVTLPLIQRLAEQSGPVDLLTTPAALPLAETNPAIGQAIPFDKNGREQGLFGLLRVARSLRARGYRRVFLPHESVRSAALARLIGASERIGFAGAPGAFLYSRRIAKPGIGHMSERLQSLAGGVPSRRPEPWITLTASDRERAGTWLAGQGIAGDFIVLAPGSRWGTKRWPYFAQLAAKLELPIVIVGGPEDAELASTIVAQTGGRAASAAGGFSLRESAALIERCLIAVTNDSVALHLASALRRPLVAIFGPTAPGFGFGPTHPDDRVAEHPSLACRPCSVHGPATCPLKHHLCMIDLPVDRVLAAVSDRLAALREPGRRETGTG
jgi:heptosyltransferase II